MRTMKFMLQIKIALMEWFCIVIVKTRNKFIKYLVVTLTTFQTIIY